MKTRLVHTCWLDSGKLCYEEVCIHTCSLETRKIVEAKHIREYEEMVNLIKK